MVDGVKVAPEVTEAPEKSVRETVEDSLIESTEEAPVVPEKETTEEVSPEAEEIAETIKPGEAEDAPKEEESEVDRILREAAEEGADEEKTPSNVQKRFDRLTAEKKALEERLAKLEAQQGAKEGKLPKYTDEQLKTALKKGIEEGDTSLVWDIMDHIRKQTKQDLIDMYEGEKNAHIDRQKRIDSEWKDTVDAYSKYADTKVPEMWLNSHKDLDLKNGTSMLYQIAMALYWNKIPEKAAYYQNQPGGQKLAVADALTYLMRTKAGKRTDTKVKTLTKQLTKERMKKSPVSGGPSGGEKPTKAPRTEAETLDDVINERRQFQAERGV